ILKMQRKIKNVVKNYTASEIKVREATSNDPWGPSTTLMSEISTLTFDPLAFGEMMNIIWKRLNDHGKNWRHVYKSLVLLDFLVRTGSEKVVKQCKDNIIFIQTLRDFQYVENGLDCGLNVRETSKKLYDLLRDEDRLKNERHRANKSKSKFGDFRNFQSVSKSKDPEIESIRPTNQNEEEIQLQLALAMSKEQHEQEMKKIKSEEIKLQMAIEESKRTAEKEVHLYVCMYVCLYVCMYVCRHVFIYFQVCMHVRMWFLCVCVCFLFVYVCFSL
ncbi:hypothetical protein HELRODRAFT_76592, partial [Helobdella robusta]|uniref:ENTH domain-containing protein n=1 Tax=Helobdella robusta TaxID=6412 RepID=T1G2M0_HELRO